jgi:DNA-binding NarL/FixJ family response regulator
MSSAAAVGAEIAVLLVEDDAIVRAWVRLALEGSEFRLGGEAATAEEGLRLVERRRADVVLVDHHLPDTSGIELIRELRQRGVTTPTLLITASAEPGLNERARDAGAQGSILKSSRSDDLVRSLHAAIAGTGPFDAGHPRRPKGMAALTPREREVLRLVVAGGTNVQIAAELGISSETVKTLLARVYAKLGVRRRAEAVAAAVKLDLV